MELSKAPVDIKTLVQTSNIQIYDQNKLIDKLKEHFDEAEQKLYVANLFLYLNYHPTNDYIVNLENVWKFIGFSNKANGKRLLKQHFTENKDYKIVFIRTDENPQNTNLGGRPQETIMLNINTFKKLCLKSNTNNADKIHDYYIKLEMVYNELIKEQLEEQQKLIGENQKKLETTQKELQKEKTWRNKMLNRRCFDADDGDHVYIFKDNLENEDSILKIGKTKNLVDRERFYSNINKSGGIVYYKKCKDSGLIEKLCHHMLNKFRENKMQEWFNIDLELVKKTIDTVIYFVDENINNMENFIPQISESFKIKSELLVKKEPVKIEPQVDKSNDFTGFLENFCEIDESFFAAKEELTKAFRIYCKVTVEKDTKNKLNTFLQHKFKSGVEFYGNIRRNVWRGFRLRPLTFSANDLDNITDLEKFIMEECTIGYTNRVSFCDFHKAFSEYIGKDVTYVGKQEIQQYLTEKFSYGRVHLSENSKTTHLFGVLGISLKDNLGLKSSKRTCKQVAQFTVPGELINTWESLTVASTQLNIPRSTLSMFIKSQKVKDNIIFRYI
jgi:phage anti-repressor protein